MFSAAKRTRLPMIWWGSPRETRSASIDPANFVSGGCGSRSEPNVLDVNPGELRRPRDAVRVEELQAFDDVARTGDVQPGLPGEPLDGAEREDVALRVSPPIGRGTVRDAE